MQDDKVEHSVDAVIPPETSQFDQIAEQQATPADPALAEASKLLLFQINRTKHLAQAFLNHKGQAVNMLGENYMKSFLARAELVVLSKIIEERLGISPAEYVKAVAEEMDKELMVMQLEHKIIITTDGVTND